MASPDLLAPCGTPAAARRHWRRREPLDEACLQANRRKCRINVRGLAHDRREIRNGIPWKPYRYNGLGYDQITGEEDGQCA